MYSIYQNTGDEGHDFDSFKERVIQICNKHRESRKALAFAFIIYDFTNPHLWEVLSDNKYWLALDQISGEYLTVFSLNYTPPKEAGFMEFLTNVKIQNNPRHATNMLIEKYFKGVTVKYPAILFFQVDNDSVIDSFLMELKEEEIEKSFLEVKGLITSAVSALQRITPENRQNYKEIFNCLEEEVKSRRFVRKILRLAKNAGSIKGLISLVKDIT